VLWLPLVVMAASLRRSASPARAIMLALGFGLMVLLGFALAIDEPTEWWRQLLGQLLEPMMQEVPPADLPQLEANLAELAGQMSGVMAAGMVASLLGCLMLGRWWQSLLFNPGGFGGEFRRLRMGQALAAAAVVLTAAHMLWQLGGEGGGLLRDLLALAQVAFALQGVAVVHALVHANKAQRGILVVMYLLLVILLGPVVLLLAMVGVVDNWFDFRSRFGRGKSADID
jgi:uncharacterized protein YybS (DUF2232 family)